MARTSQYKSFMIDNFTVLQGKNAQGNWDIIDMCSSNDLWFHIDDSPSAHFIIKINDEIPSNKIIRTIALLCKKSNKIESKKNFTEIIYGKLENVTKSEKVGMVHCDHKKMKTIRV